MRKLILIISIVVLFTSCSADNITSEKLQIICTVFPQYDFAKRIAGDLADVTLLNIGTDSHHVEQTSADIIKITDSDLFITIGGVNDIWTNSIQSLKGVNDKTIFLVDLINLLEEEHDEHEHDEQDEAEYDEHVWISPKNALIIAEAIYNKLCDLDFENKESYTDNYNVLKDELVLLDESIKKKLSEAELKPIVFGDRFAFRYFTEEYGLQYLAAFSSCSTDTDVNASTIAYLVEEVRENDIKCVYYLENGTKSIAETICKETGSQALMLNSCHTVTADEIKSGITYTELMYQNLDNILKGFE